MYILNLIFVLSGFGTKAGLYCILEKIVKSFMPYIFINVEIDSLRTSR